MFNMSFKTGNAAFHDPYEDGCNAYAKAEEVARILRNIADQIENGMRTEGSCMDYNGNKVGEWKLD